MSILVVAAGNTEPFSLLRVWNGDGARARQESGGVQVYMAVTWSELNPGGGVAEVPTAEVWGVAQSAPS